LEHAGFRREACFAPLLIWASYREAEAGREDADLALLFCRYQCKSLSNRFVTLFPRLQALSAGLV
jgi:hypothetical protein